MRVEQRTPAQDSAKNGHNQVWLGFLTGAVYATLISLTPVMLIYHRTLNTFFWQQSWQKTVFFIIAIFFGGLAVIRGLPDERSASETTAVLSRRSWLQIMRKHEFSIFISGFFFFYVACCALCQKLNFTQLATETGACEVWSTFGLLIILLAMTIQVQILRLVRLAHPIYFSCLLLLLGLPFLFSVWMPLFAVPGAFIIFKWRIKMQDKITPFLAETSAELPGEKPDKQQRWQLLPYIY